MALVRGYPHLSPSHLQEAVEKVARFGKTEQPVAPANQEPKTLEKGEGELEAQSCETGPDLSVSVPTVTKTVMRG